jgi:ribonuclease Z
MNDKILLAEQTGHTTAGEAGKMAAAAGVSCLITGHYSSRYKDVRPLVAEANISFPHVLEAVEGKKYNIRNLAKGLKE